MRISKLAGIRQLSFGKQTVRTAGKVIGFTTFMLGIIFLSEHLDQTPEPALGILPSLGIALGGTVLEQSIKDEVPARHLQRWRVSVRKQ